ncbi:hypothetical protein CDD83_6083 [Cordyceps sp. RAO-2017]|nr:hypothetical protein CDD83_6083 [Cordyceps sp. RAO-2017]
MMPPRPHAQHPHAQLLHFPPPTPTARFACRLGMPSRPSPSVAVVAPHLVASKRARLARRVAVSSADRRSPFATVAIIALDPSDACVPHLWAFMSFQISVYETLTAMQLSPWS